MSIKRYDKDLGNWLPLASNQAKGIRVVDAEGNFTEKDEDGNVVKSVNNVEEALKYNANRIKTLEERVEYIYENGTIGGGGGGGGGSVMPTITIISPMNISTTIDEEVKISFQFSSPNIGITRDAHMEFRMFRYWDVSSLYLHCGRRWYVCYNGGCYHYQSRFFNGKVQL